MISSKQTAVLFVGWMLLAATAVAGTARLFWPTIVSPGPSARQIAMDDKALFFMRGDGSIWQHTSGFWQQVGMPGSRRIAVRDGVLYTLESDASTLVFDGVSWSRSENWKEPTAAVSGEWCRSRPWDQFWNRGAPGEALTNRPIQGASQPAGTKATWHQDCGHLASLMFEPECPRWASGTPTR